MPEKGDPSVADRRLEIARAAALEWRERYRKVLSSQEAVWNSAVRNCIELVGMRHEPAHPWHACLQCWIHSRLLTSLKLEEAGHISLKERLLKSLIEPEDSAYKGLSYEQRRGYKRALTDVRDKVKTLVADGI